MASIKLEVVELGDGNGLDTFFMLIDQMNANQDKIHSVRVGIDVEGVKFSINGSVWTPGIGEHSS
jgi:hypothetical protein